MRSGILAGVVLVILGQGLAAQARPASQPGVRAEAPPSSWVGMPACTGSVGGASLTSGPLSHAVAGRVVPDVPVLPLPSRDSEEGARSRTFVGAAVGALAGGVATYVLLYRGGSTSFCDRSANQDAMGRRECLGLMVVGTAAGAGLGAWVGARFR